MAASFPSCSLTGGIRRGVIAAGVSAMFVAVFFLFPRESAVQHSALGIGLREVLAGAPLTSLIQLDLDGLARGVGANAAPLFAVPPLAAAGVALSAFHDQTFLVQSGFSPGFVYAHHYGPTAGIAIAGGILGVGRIAAAWPRLRRWLIPLLSLHTLAIALIWREDFERRALRRPWTTHPAAAFAPQIPNEAILFTEWGVSAAHARRRWAYNPVTIHALPPTQQVEFAVVRSGTEVSGVVLAESGGGRLVRDPDRAALMTVPP